MTYFQTIQQTVKLNPVRAEATLVSLRQEKQATVASQFWEKQGKKILQQFQTWENDINLNTANLSYWDDDQHWNIFRSFRIYYFF